MKTALVAILVAFTLNACSQKSDPVAPKDDGTIIDKKTGAIWQENASKSYMTWPGAQKYCASLSLAGHSDWKLPSKDNLVSLWKDGNFRSKDDSFFWSSETDPGTQVFGDALAWIVNSKDGSVSHAPTSASNKDYLNSVRCVRFGK